MAGCAGLICSSSSTSSACILALSNPGLSGLPLSRPGLCSAYVGLRSALGLLKWFLSGRSFVPPNRLNAWVRGVMGLSAGLLIPPVDPGVRGGGVLMSKAVLGHW